VFSDKVMQTRAAYLRAEVEKCRAQGRKTATATAAFAYFELADQMLEMAKQAELDDAKEKT
jgi:hypothetical protein